MWSLYCVLICVSIREFGQGAVSIRCAAVRGYFIGIDEILALSVSGELLFFIVRLWQGPFRLRSMFLTFGDSIILYFIW